MKRSIRPMANGLVILSFTAIFCLAAKAQEQTRSAYVVSAKAGGINAVSGSVIATRKGADAAGPVSSLDDLASGDRLATGADGRVEMRLNPGSYLRLAENSELELTDASLDSLRLRLISGIALVEIMSASETLPPVEVTTPHTRIVIRGRGLYRVGVSAESGTVVRVRKGRALVGDGAATEAKEGTEVTVDRSGATNVAKFDRNVQDTFDLWSEKRAETLADTNSKLSKSTIASAYSHYRSDPFELGIGARSFDGYWIHDPFFSGYTFLPQYAGWSSPYGHGYRIGFGYWFYSTGFSGYGRGYRTGSHPYDRVGSIIHWSGHRSFSHHSGGHHSFGHHGRGHHGGRHR